MPYKPKPIKKLYYTIGEVAEIFNVFASRIRYYEEQFGIKVKRNRKGTRMYTDREIRQFERIIYLHDVVKLTLSGVKQWLHSGKPFPFFDNETLTKYGKQA